MKFSQVKTLKSELENLHSQPSLSDVIYESIHNQNDDFTVEGVRFISSDSIDKIQQEELEGSESLGYFNASFLSSVTGIDIEVFEAMQEVEAYDAISKLVLSLDKLEDLQSEYVSADGYGHHFNSYDFSESEIMIDGVLFHAFDLHE